MERAEGKHADAKVDASFEHLKEVARSATEQAREQLQPIQTWLQKTITERPLLTLAGVFGVGYVVGRLLRR